MPNAHLDSAHLLLVTESSLLPKAVYWQDSGIYSDNWNTELGTVLGSLDIPPVRHYRKAEPGQSVKKQHLDIVTANVY